MTDLCQMLPAGVTLLFLGCVPSGSSKTPPPTEAAAAKPAPVVSVAGQRSVLSSDEAAAENSDAEPEPPLPGLDPVPRNRLAEAGIARYAAAGCEIVTDLPAAEAGELLAHAVDVRSALQDRFGPLTTASGDAAAIRGYVMRSVDAFREAALLPEELPAEFHGRLRGREFWMTAGEPGYYRRHLFAHEACHVWQLLADPTVPSWSVAALEGEAERFATHRVTDGETQFGILPQRPSEVPRFGRIERLQAIATDSLVKGGNWPTVTAVRSISPSEFAGTLDVYALVWGMAQCVPPEQWGSLDGESLAAAELLWSLYRDAVDYGVEPARLLTPSVIEKPDDETADTYVTLAADRGWHAVAVQGDVRLSPSGRCRLLDADRSVTVETTPEGVRYDYAGGFPLGVVVARLVDPSMRPGRPFAVSVGKTVTVPPGSLLLLRVNSHWPSLRGNVGQFDVRLSDASD